MLHGIFKDLSLIRFIHSLVLLTELVFSRGDRVALSPFRQGK